MRNRTADLPLATKVTVHVLVGAVLILTLALPAGQRISAAVAAERSERAEQVATRGCEEASVRLEAIARRLAGGNVDAARTRKALVAAFDPIPGSIDERGCVHVGPVYAEPGMDESFRLTFRLDEARQVVRVQSRGSAGGTRATVERDFALFAER